MADKIKLSMYDPEPKYWAAIIEAVTESQHQCLDGWEPEEVKAIEAYLKDIAKAATIIYNEQPDLEV